MANDNLEPKETAIIGSSVTKDAKGKSVVEFDKKFETSFTIEPDHIFASGSNDAYMSVVGEANKNKISYIAETGELLFGDARHASTVPTHSSAKKRFFMENKLGETKVRLHAA